MKHFLPAAKPTGLVEVSWFFFFFLFFLIICSKKTKTAQTNMGAYVVWAANFKSDFRFYLRGCLEAVSASKPHFLRWSQIDGSSVSSHNESISPKFIKKSPKILKNVSKNPQKSPKNQFLHFSPCQPQVY